MLLLFLECLIKRPCGFGPLNRVLDKLSGCRETAYEGKTNDVGAKKQKEQKEQKEQRNKGENKRKQKCKRKKQKK